MGLVDLIIIGGFILVIITFFRRRHEDSMDQKSDVARKQALKKELRIELAEAEIARLKAELE